MINNETRERWDRQISTIQGASNEKQIRLTEWEDEFLDSILYTLSKGKDISWRQSKALRSIYKRVE